MTQAKRRRLFDRAIVGAAIRDSFAKLDPRLQARNPVMFVVLVGAVLVTLLLVRDIAAARDVLFDLQIALWLWFTLLFANFAEAMAEGRGKAQAETLRRGRTETIARRVTRKGEERVPATAPCARETASSSRRGRSSRATARSSRESPRWTSPRSRANRPPSSGNRAATVPR